MKLRNKKDHAIYNVRTEADGRDGFFIFAFNESADNVDFCMHYLTLKEFTDEWEDID